MIADRVAEVMEHSINEAGKHFNLSIEQLGEAEIGANWMEVH